MSDLTIIFEDGSRAEVDIGPPELVAFERKYGIEWQNAEKEAKIEHPFFMAWNYLRRHRVDKTVEFPSFDDWLDTVADIDADPKVAAKAKRARSVAKRA